MIRIAVFFLSLYVLRLVAVGLVTPFVYKPKKEMSKTELTEVPDGHGGFLTHDQWSRETDSTFGGSK